MPHKSPKAPIKIAVLDGKSPYLDEVVDLGTKNSATLGFLPRGAFEGHAKRKQIIVALDRTKKIIGYLLYRTNQSNDFAYITHLCVDENVRRKSVAQLLFEKFKSIVLHNYVGIKVRCRRDYEASKVWPKLGFYARDEIKGRSKHGSTLTIWWYDFGVPNLFTFANAQRTLSKIKVPLDANIFFELMDQPTPKNEESHALLADWLEENIALCVTAELFNEIDRQEDEKKRIRAKNFAETFILLPTRPDDQYQEIKSHLRTFFPRKLSERDWSDIRQLARAIAAGAPFFVTCDGNLLKKSKQIEECFNIQIIRPSHFIIHQDELIRDAEYKPIRLAGTKLQKTRVDTAHSIVLEDSFRHFKSETKSCFKNYMQPFLADPITYETVVLKDADKELGLITFGRQHSNQLDIPIIRIKQGYLSAIIAKHIIFDTIFISSKESRVLTKITDSNLSDEIIDTLKESGFILAGDCWIKANLNMVKTIKDILPELNSLKGQFKTESQYFNHLINVLNEAVAANNIKSIFEVERSLFPCKISDIDIPAFVVSINPEWAEELFDSELLRQTLFGGKPDLLLNTENAYYRDCAQKILTAPARILWYVNKGKGQYQGTKAIRACSYLDEVVIDKPKALFSRFERYGIYKWKDVFEIAKEDINKKIMAFRFSNTELFKTPVHRDILQAIWKKEEDKNFHIQGPISIPHERFFHLYKLGTGTH